MDLQGGKLGCSPDPPSVNSVPWNRLTVQKLITVGTTNRTGLVDCLDLCQWLHEQIGSPFGKYLDTVKPVICIRIHYVRAWNMTGRTIGIQPYDYTATSSASATDLEELGGWIDSGTQTNLPAVGYKWPITASNQVVTVQVKTGTGDADTEGNRKICVILGTSGDQIIAQFAIEWRFPPPHTTGLMLQSLYTIAGQVARNGVKMRAALAQSNRVLETVASQMPGTIAGAAKVFVIDPLRDDKQENLLLEQALISAVPVDGSELLSAHEVASNLSESFSDAASEIAALRFRLAELES